MSELALLDALADIPRRAARDPRRLSTVQELCVQRLEGLGVRAATETLVEGQYRAKRWDVASLGTQRPRIAISARSFMASRSNAAVNRLDDLLAEAANIHRRQPEAVLGFLAVVAVDQPGRRSASTSCWDAERLGTETGLVCRRATPAGHPELFESGCVLAVDFARLTVTAVEAPGLLGFDAWLAHLVQLQTHRSATRRLCERRQFRSRVTSPSGRLW